MKRSLDTLLGPDERHATFHDALFARIHVDYTERRFVARARLCVGDPNASDEAARERRREGELVVDGLTIWALEPPATRPEERDRSNDGLWLTSDGPLAEAPTAAGKALAQSLEPDDVGWFLFFDNLNAFGYLAGQRASFKWL